MSLPPSDRVAVALFRIGAVPSAIEVAQLAVARADARKIEARVALERMRSGESPDDGREAPAIDLALVGVLLDHGRLFEARAVLRSGAVHGVLAEHLTRALDEALAPFPDDADPSFAAVLQLTRSGQAASAVRALDEVISSGPVPDWLIVRHHALTTLLHGAWRDEALEDAAPLPAVTRDTVIARLRARDLPAALVAAKTAGAVELADVLARLVGGSEGVLSESADGDDHETSPMAGHRLAEMHLRMGMLDESDRDYRSLLKHSPNDERARSMLADVIHLRRALGESTEPLPPRAGATVDTLKKNAPRASAKGWAAGGRYASFAETEAEESTAQLQAADEAELLLKLGKSEQALDMYRILAIRHPSQVAFRKRIVEIQALIAQRLTPIAGEATVQRDMSDLTARAVPTNAFVQLPERAFPKFGEDEETGTDATTVDLPPSRDDT
jgi:tetratricopeptide (TPR) repeat protein